MIEHSEGKIIEQISNCLNHLDESVQVSTPDIGQFRKMVAQGAQKKQERAKREVVIFIISAISILSVEIYAFNLSIIFFIALQSIAVYVPMVLFLRWLAMGHRKVKLHEK